MSWIEENSGATRIQQAEALADAIALTACDPTAAQLRNFGLPEDWLLADEPLEVARAFDAIVSRCSECDWWCPTDELNEDGKCDECRSNED